MTTSSLDTVLSRRRLSPNDWVKSSLKVTLPDINSSVMSNSPATAQRLYHLKENIQQISQCGVPKYTIQSLLGISQGTHLTHTDACSKVVEFLNSSGNEEIQTEGSLSRMDNLPAHFLSKKVIPDVAWFTDTQHNQLVCAIEVESKNDRISSLVKLGLDLLEHLRYIRNRDDRITEITGFLFPLWTKSPARPTAVEEGYSEMDR